MMTRQQIRRLSDDALDYTIQDLRQVIDIQDHAARAGHHVPKLGQYWDDWHECIGERNRRERLREAGAICAACGGVVDCNGCAVACHTWEGGAA